MELYLYLALQEPHLFKKFEDLTNYPPMQFVLDTEISYLDILAQFQKILYLLQLKYQVLVPIISYLLTFNPTYL